MSIDYSISLDAQYTVHGVDAVLTVACGSPSKAVTVIDKTDGVAVGGTVETQTIEPGACVRVSELTEKGIARADLKGGAIEFNGKTWAIRATMPRPMPTGESTGELLLILEESDDDE